MVISVGSEVDHVPAESLTSGQLPSTEEVSANCTWSPGAPRVWSAIALDGVIARVILHVLPDPPQETVSPKTSKKRKRHNLSNVRRTAPFE